MKTREKMFIIILTTLGVLGFYLGGIITYLDEVNLSIKSIENPSGDLVFSSSQNQKNQIWKVGSMYQV